MYFSFNDDYYKKFVKLYFISKYNTLNRFGAIGPSKNFIIFSLSKTKREVNLALF